MAQVGEFRDFSSLKRRMIRGPVNIYDKACVVSIYPKDIDEKKVTLDPGRFLVPAGSIKAPSVLVVGPSVWWREIDEEQPLLEIPTGAIMVAEAIVKDYCNGIFGCNMDDAMPGLFYIPGAKVDAKGRPDIKATVEWIQKDFTKELKATELRQNNWYRTLVKHADSLWARSNGNPLAISDDMRMAAKELGQTTKDWLKDFQMVDMVRCVACGSLKNPSYPVCAACHFPDPNHPLTKDILAAKAAMPNAKTE